MIYSVKIVLAIITVMVLYTITTQAKYYKNVGRRANLRPITRRDNVERNEEKLLVVFNKTCVDSIEEAEQKISDLLQVYNCLTKWEGIYIHKSRGVRGIYEDSHGNYRAYFTVNQTTNESSCIDMININHDEYCIDMIDYEMKLKAIDCKSSSVYSSPLSSYYRWHLDIIDGVIDNSYKHIDTSSADGNIDIYILDSGILETHNEFSNVKSYTLMDPSYATPETGHGTHVAGIAVGKTCGITNHNIFDYPVCRGSTESCYSSYIDDAFAAILSRLSSTKRRGVINMSFGTSTTPSLYYMQWYNNYLSNLVNAGAIPVAAAGNEAHDACISYPAASPYALGIGSHDNRYNISSFSNYGSCVDIYAPGDDIISSWFTSNTGYALSSGTSMATPVVTGLIADLLWYNNTLTFNQIKSILQKPSNDVTLQSCPSGTDACKAIKINCASVYNTMSPTTTTTSVPTSSSTTSTITPSATVSTTTSNPTTSRPTTSNPTTSRPTTSSPTTSRPTTSSPTTSRPTTSSPTTSKPTPKPTLKPTATTSSPSLISTCRLSGSSCFSNSQCCSSTCKRRTCY